MINVPDYEGTGVYGIYNLNNMKWYIGSSKNIRQRIHDHVYTLEKGKHFLETMQHDYDQGDEFQAIILQKELTCHDINWEHAEKKHMEKYDAIYNGYNRKIPCKWSDDPKVVRYLFNGGRLRSGFVLEDPENP